MKTREVKLGEVANVKGGKRIPKGIGLINIPNGHPYIRVRDLNNKRVLELDNSYEYVDNETQKVISKYTVKTGDVVLSIVGTIGLVAIVGRTLDGANLTENCVKLSSFHGVNRDFLYYYLRSDCGQQEIRCGTVGAVQAKLPIKNIQNIAINLPDYTTQERIASLLLSIDRKIELNQKINDNLEQQAVTYFQELYINNANPMWQIGTISDLGTVVGGSTPSKTKPEYYTNNGIAWITPKDLSINKSKFISHGENDITELGLKNSSATVMPKGTVLFSSRAPIGYIAIASNEVTTNQGFKSVVPYLEIGTAFVYFFLKHSLPVIESAASGSTFKEISGSAMKNIPAIIPDRSTLDQFNSFCAPIFAQQKILEDQNYSLAMLRDSLLPKLMSGAIDIASIQL
ncbi:MAG: restriction endonuclease subunit S [Faecalibacterium prausnitzii]|nr:restriction endonuclease subunit S [Faecalibacterium prausnitzii]